MEDDLRKLREAVEKFAHDREIAEARAQALSEVIAQLRGAKMLAKESTVVGRVIHRGEVRDHSDEGGPVVCQYFAVGIKGSRGVGAFEFWFEDGDILEEDQIPTYRFLPFAQCEPVLQAAMAEHIDALLGQMKRECKLVTPAPANE